MMRCGRCNNKERRKTAQVGGFSLYLEERCLGWDHGRCAIKKLATRRVFILNLLDQTSEIGIESERFSRWFDEVFWNGDGQ